MGYNRGHWLLRFLGWYFDKDFFMFCSGVVAGDALRQMRDNHIRIGIAMVALVFTLWIAAAIRGGLGRIKDQEKLDSPTGCEPSSRYARK